MEYSLEQKALSKVCYGMSDSLTFVQREYGKKFGRNATRPSEQLVRR